MFFAPGRVNLIGEHTDYNGGYVLPCALSFGTYMLVRKNEDDVIRFHSENFDFNCSIGLDDIAIKVGDEWVNYPLGVIDQFLKLGKEVSGVDILYAGDIPDSAGLSSSASIEMVTAVAFNDLFGYNINRTELVKLAQKAENEFVGVQCGIMDQFAVGMSRKKNALFLNCATLQFVHTPMDLGNYRLVIANTNKKRGLADSKYNERVGECNEAVKLIRKEKPFNRLGELNVDDLLPLKEQMPPTIWKRAFHVVSEDGRVLEAVKALLKKELDKFGKLMNESHDSLRDNYEVTGFELDTLVEEARKIEGVLGSRMTGAGFGGCTVTLINKNYIDQLISVAGKSYGLKTGLLPEFYLPEISGAAHKIA